VNPAAAAAPSPVHAGLAPRLNIGLTGGIGSGKSTVAALLAAQGAHLVDTDAIARALTLPGGAAMPAIAHAFGPQAVAADGSLDRAHMRQQVFADASAKARLEAILHPLIGQHALAQAALAPIPALGKTSVVVFDVPLLAESSHWRQRVQRILVVDCSEDTQVARVAQRPGWTADTARAVIAQQATRQARRAIADAVIHNDGIGLDALQQHVQQLWSLWTATGHPTSHRA
jgi:dephospho-CoA kinase